MPNPQPVYIVASPPPPRESFLRRFVWVPIVVFALLIGASAIAQPAAGPRASSAAGGGATDAPAPTVDQAAIDAAGQQAVNDLEAVLSAKDVSCSTLEGAKYDKCTAEYDAISKRWDQLFACTSSATSMEAVVACKRAAGVK